MALPININATRFPSSAGAFFRVLAPQSHDQGGKKPPEEIKGGAAAPPARKGTPGKGTRAEQEAQRAKELRRRSAAGQSTTEAAVPPAVRFHQEATPGTIDEEGARCVDPLADPNAIDEDPALATYDDQGLQDPDVAECSDGEPLSAIPMEEPSLEVKMYLVMDAKDRIGARYADFLLAVEHQLAEIKKAAEEESWSGIFWTIIDIGVGALMPGISKLAKGIAERIEKVVAPGIVAIVEKVEKRANLEELFNKATEHFTAMMKEEARNSVGVGGAEAFLKFLRQKKSVYDQDLGESLKDKSIEEIVAVWAAFDARAVQMEDFEGDIAKLVSEFQSTVKLIGERKPWSTGKDLTEQGGTEHDIAVWVKDESDPPVYPELRMALVHRKTTIHPGLPGVSGGSDDEYEFKRWIEDSSVREFAKAKTLAMFPDRSDLVILTRGQLGLI